MNTFLRKYNRILSFFISKFNKIIGKFYTLKNKLKDECYTSDNKGKEDDPVISKALPNNVYEPQYNFPQKNEFMKLLENVKEDMNQNGIYFSIEDIEIKELRNNHQILDIVKLGLELAEKLCIESTLRQDRFIRIRARILQKKLFIKIQYSLSNSKFPSTKYDSIELSIARKVEYTGGYFKHQTNQDAGDIKIALPIS